MNRIDVVWDDRFDPPFVAVSNEKIIADGHSRKQAYENARKVLIERERPLDW